LRSLIGLACVSGAYVVPEGLAVAYAAQLHAGTAAVGWLMAASPAGMVLGMIALQRLPQRQRRRWIAPLAMASCLALVPTAWTPPLVVAVLLWCASGVATSFNLITQATFVQAVPDHARGQAVGVANAALRLAQGVGIVGAGLLAQVWSPGVVIAVIALVGTAWAGATAAAWHRAVSPRPAAARGETDELST
jgi:predicted MFS family arabinose efflux permease